MRGGWPTNRYRSKRCSITERDDEQMNRYHDSERIRALVQPDCVHRDVYTDAELFELEMERLWGRTWIYVGHDSQVPNAGDYLTVDIGRQPVVLVRGA